MASALLNTVYTVVVVAVAVLGVGGVMWLARARSGDGAEEQSTMSGTMITIAVVVFTVATAALLLA